MFDNLLEKEPIHREPQEIRWLDLSQLSIPNALLVLNDLIPKLEQAAGQKASKVALDTEITPVPDYVPQDWVDEVTDQDHEKVLVTAGTPERIENSSIKPEVYAAIHGQSTNAAVDDSQARLMADALEQIKQINSLN